MLTRTVYPTLLILLCSLNCLAQKNGRAPAEVASRSHPLIEAGNKLADERKWTEAIETYNLAIRLDPKNTEGYIRLGDAYMGAGNWSAALEAYKRAVSIAPGDADAQYALGDAYNTMGQHGDAFAPLVKAIQIAPDFAEAHYGIGYAYLRGSQFEKSLPYLRGAIRLQADYAEAHYSLALAYLNLGNSNGLEEERRKLAALDPDLSSKLEKEIKNFDKAASQAATEAAELTRKRLTTSPTQPAATPAPVRSTVSSTPKKTERATKGSQAATKAAFELTFWETIKDSTDPEDFKAYLDKYPQGQFADLARRRTGPAVTGCSGELFGAWDTNLGRLLITKGEGNVIKGSYTQGNGSFKVELMAENKSLLSGQWKDDSGAGDVTLKLNGDHKTIVGTLYGDPTRIITGQCVEGKTGSRN